MSVDGLVRAPPISWGETLSGKPILDRNLPIMTPVMVRRWQNISPEIDQVALNQHYVSIHLGGPKRLLRCGEGSTFSREVNDGDYSIVPAGAAFRWNTIGKVDFAHIYFESKVLDKLIAETFDRDPARIELSETLGSRDPLIRTLMLSLLDELCGEDLHRAYLDHIIQLLLSRVLCLHSDVRLSNARMLHALAPFRLRRAFEYIDANLHRSIGVGDIAEASGISPYHFSRAFRHATGRPPYAYLLERRVARSKELLKDCDLKLSHIAEQCGFTSLSQFSRMFRHHVGSTPTYYRSKS